MLSNKAHLHNKIQIFIRCDSSSEIGGGHMMRCLALAEQFREAGHESNFLCKDLPGSLAHLTKEQGFEHTAIPPKLSEREEAQYCLKIIMEHENAVVVVDHYLLGHQWEDFFTPSTFVMVIDDLGRNHRGHLLLDSNFHLKPEKLYENKLPKQMAKLLGPHHALLRKEFRQPISENPRDGVLVFFGSGDPTGESLKFIKTAASRSTNTKYHLLLSRSNLHLNEIEKIEKPKNLTIHINPTNVVQLFSKSSLYFGSGGTVTWERMRCGLPGIVVSVADNQEDISKDLAEADQQIYLGRAREVDFDKALNLCEEKLSDPTWCRTMAERNRHLVQPLRIEDVFACFNSIRARNATVADAQFLYELRRDPETARGMFDQKDFSFESHRDWLSNKINKADTTLSTILLHGAPIGQVRVDPDLHVSVSLAATARGKGLSSQALELGLELDRPKRKGRVTYRAQIKQNNAASRKAFEKMGFKFHSQEELGDELCDLLLFESDSSQV